jgi:hypothetical protein
MLRCFRPSPRLLSPVPSGFSLAHTFCGLHCRATRSLVQDVCCQPWCVLWSHTCRCPADPVPACTPVRCKLGLGARRHEACGKGRRCSPVQSPRPLTHALAVCSGEEELWQRVPVNVCESDTAQQQVRPGLWGEEVWVGGRGSGRIVLRRGRGRVQGAEGDESWGRGLKGDASAEERHARSRAARRASRYQIPRAPATSLCPQSSLSRLAAQ